MDGGLEETSISPTRIMSFWGESGPRGPHNINEGKRRLLSPVISGGMILNSCRLADDAQGQQLAQEVYKIGDG